MIKTVKVEDLKRATYNPRITLQKGDPEYDDIASSMKEFGYVEPIVWNERTGNVVGGHQRLTVLIDSGTKEVEVSVVNLSERDEKQLNLALNKIKGEWDYDKLEDILSEFTMDDIVGTGFTASDLAVMFSEEDTDETYDFSDLDFEPQTYGVSYVVTLKFKDAEAAEMWADENGYEGQVKRGTSTTVIRVDE